jgi:hypothetical protein
MAIHLGNDSAARRQQRFELDAERDADREAAGAAAERTEPRNNTPPSSPSALSQLLAPSPRDPNAQRARWGRDPEADSRRPPRGNAGDAPAPRSAPPTTPASPAAPAAPRRNVGERAASAAYVGERPVDDAWLAQRESALKALRAEYEAARTIAQAGNGTGPGWVEAAAFYDERTGTYQTQGLLVASNPAAPPPPRGRDHGDPRDTSPTGSTRVFSEEAFAAHFKAQQSAQPGTALKSLAACYEADAATLFAKQPTLWALAVKDHALNAGPPPPGRAMGGVEQLGMLDLYMADPQIAALITAYGGKAVAATGPIAIEQVRLYGAERFAQLSRLNNAMGAVRNLYSQALARAEQSGRGVGWSEHTQTVTEVGDNENAHQSTTHQVTTRTFDPDAFTAWYIKQDGLANKTFASFYGQSRTTFRGNNAAESSTGGPIATLSFDNPNWQISELGSGMSHTALRPININDTPRLHDRSAVGFDLEAGWATHPSNIRERRDWGETLVMGAFVGVVTYVTAGLAGPVFGTSLAGTMATAAVAGAAGSMASGVMSGNFAWRDVLKGALAGGLSAGLTQSLGPYVQSAGPVGTIALRTTVQGGIQALLGGSFKDGAIAGFASGLADLAKGNIESGIDLAVKSGDMTATEAIAARGAARIVGSAIRALGNPNDPQYAFASSFLSDLLPKPPVQTGPTTEQVRELFGPDGSGTVLTDLQPRGGGSGSGGPPVAPTPEPSPPAPSSPPPDGPQEPQGPSDPNVQRIEIVGRRLLSFDDGRLEVDSQGQGVFHLATGGMLAIGSVADALPGLEIGGARTISGSLLARLVGVITLPVMLTGDTPRVTLQINERLRFERFEDQAYGRLLERDTVSGQWQVLRDDVREYRRPGGYAVLGDEELARLNAPAINTPAPPQPSRPPPLPIDRPNTSTPGLEAAPPVAGTPGLGAAPTVTADDLLMERNRAEQQRFRNALIDEARRIDPDFDPSRYDAHHAIPLNEYPQLNELRDRLAGWGIDMNDPSINGVMLPRSPDVGSGTVHADTQRNPEYEAAIRRRFAGVTTRERAVEVLDDIKQELRNGTFVPPKK